ncbi:hypothetical protein LTR36_003629 [Oleoguttula mirabilis]|uniref:Cns1/TTC4 wheel domain-containing protein n=1 Tax=Oleoguttula mirabilis TaxID=1507867 RepID=A0AAV9JI39_9PEZI|nr:hypothetical protein LTR36_003629 [Oleoguttula mirabilis]
MTEALDLVERLNLQDSDGAASKAQSENAGPGNTDGAPTVLSAELPPARQKTADELIAELKKIPLFMTNLDDLDEDNEQLQALRALAYEGTRAEIADNFRNQGNDCVKQKQYPDAREFYTKALQALKGPAQPQDPEEGPSDVQVIELDEEAEEKKERVIEEACYANRALCNLEMKNYGSCQRDCAGALRLNARNVKAWYRAASACLALDKIPEALDACQSGLELDSANVALKTLLSKIEKRQQHLAEVDAARKQREERSARERATLRFALKHRNITTRATTKAPDMEDATVSLADPVDANSTLSFPVMLLYPLHAQSDFVKAFAEDESLGHHLEYILPTPWDSEHEYTPQNVECYMETIQGGLIKAGKKLSLLNLLGSGKMEIVDGLVKVNVVPKTKAGHWIEEFKLRRGKQ